MSFFRQSIEFYGQFWFRNYQLTRSFSSRVRDFDRLRASVATLMPSTERDATTWLPIMGFLSSETLVIVNNKYFSVFQVLTLACHYS